MPSTIVLAYAYRSDYLARCLALETSRCIRPFARSLARSSINTLALPVFYLKRLRRAVSRARSVQCVPAIIGCREILVIEDANAYTYIASRKKCAVASEISSISYDRAKCRNLNTLRYTSWVNLYRTETRIFLAIKRKDWMNLWLLRMFFTLHSKVHTLQIQVCKKSSFNIRVWSIFHVKIIHHTTYK